MITKRKWNAGPWRVNNQCPAESEHTTVCCHHNLAVANCDPYLEDDGARSWGMTREAVDANCRLIAAAPEMFEALLAIYESAPPEVRSMQKFDAARLALEKAVTGRVEKFNDGASPPAFIETCKKWAKEFEEEGLFGG